jgi:hypothetical protein
MMASSFGSSGTEQVSVKVCAVLEVIAEAARVVTRIGQTSTWSVAIGSRLAPLPPKRET